MELTEEQKKQVADWEAREYRYATEPIDQALTDEEKQTLQNTALADGANAWEYVLSKPKKIQRWVAIAIMSCLKKGYGLNRGMINWELRDLRYAGNPLYR